MKKLITLMFLLASLICRGNTLRQDTTRTSTDGGKGQIVEKELNNLFVIGKDKTQRLREGAFSVNAVNVGEKANTITDITEIINRTSGVKVRTDGGMGSDFDLSINGLSGNSIRYFIDGVPLDSKGSGIKFSDIPVNMVQRVEIFKGVVPASFGIDALGGVVNIVTRQQQRSYVDASYTVGSYGTHQVHLNGQYVEPRTGLIFRGTMGYNHSLNDYKMKEVEVWDASSRKYVLSERKRFHDTYSSVLGQFDLGVMNKKWTDAAFVSFSYSQMHKDLQTGATQSRVYGMAERNSKAWSVSARYEKKHFLFEGTDIRLSASHTWDNSETVDTCYRNYDWNGNYIPSSRNEITGRERSLRHYSRPMTNVLANIGHTFNDNHQVDFNYSLNRIGNDQTDEVSELFQSSNDVLEKHILSLSYNQMLFGEKMKNSFFFKDYINHLYVGQTYIPTVTNSKDVMGNNTKNYWGGGVAFSYTIMDQLGAKASYERSTRLPLSRELLGNASTIYPNLSLKPEESNNWNLGVFGSFAIAKEHSLSYDINGFIRDVDNYIQPTISEKEGMMQYANLSGINVKGVEAEVRYVWRNRLNATANFSWEDARDRMKIKSDGKPSATYDNRVPNRPWKHANVACDYTFSNISCSTDRLTLGMDYQWVNWYFLTWEAYGYAPNKARIPSQNIFDATATYSLREGMYNITLGCNNIFDHIVYDNYKLQKPGRYLFLKFRVVI